MAVKTLSEAWTSFVAGSEGLSGIAPFNPQREKTERHLEIARIIAGAVRLMHPCLVNGALTKRTEQWLRGGTQFASQGRVPKASLLQEFIDEWVEKTQEGIARFGSASEEDREAFAWAMHDELMCAHPFQEGSGRTARLMLNHIRVLLRLPVQVISNAEAGKYFDRLDEYRKKHFLPWLREKEAA